jgi:hypothetical protein
LARCLADAIEQVTSNSAALKERTHTPPVIFMNLFLHFLNSNFPWNIQNNIPFA